ncbi:hypothetical protein [Corallococcus aberystwythensis]|uniref:Uncharacterized protein n=1 Tax=Corallococcus aberystwythensis TaxID=2316722 RepID=A0A3A8QR73_9BACT|nr:hypothetical protein [Corallococcus aberystwythensis]RKH70311.1 hypothetical protein D7W81_09500 [Corallococcus aberystwythensis]
MRREDSSPGRRRTGWSPRRPSPRRGRRSPGLHAEIQIHAKLTHSDDLRFSIGHELAEIADIVQRHPDATQEEINAQMRAGVFQEGAGSAEATSHDRAAAKEMGALYRELQRLQQEQARNGSSEGAVAMARRRAQVDQVLSNMGLDEPAHLERKLGLLTEAGAPPELVKEVQTRHDRARELAEEALAGTGSARDDALRALTGASGAEFERIKALAVKSPRDVMDILRVYYVKHFRKPSNQIAERLAGAKELPNVAEYVETRLKGAQETQARGYPYGFKDKASFDVFKSKLLALLKEYGMPTDDVVVQGGAVTKSPAKDIDIAVRVDAVTYEAIRLRLRVRLADGKELIFDRETKAHINSEWWRERLLDVVWGGMSRKMEASFSQAARGIAGEGISIDVSLVSSADAFDLGPFIRF